MTSPRPAASVIYPEFEIIADLTGLIDTEAEQKKLEKERAKLLAGIQSRRGKLENEKFVASAPPEIVQREREGLVQLEDQLRAIELAIDELKQQA